MLRIWDWIDTSSAETGSSATMSRGFRVTARAKPILCALAPPRTRAGRGSIAFLASPTSRTRDPTRSHCSLREPIPCTLSGSRRDRPRRACVGVERGIGVLEHDLEVAPLPRRRSLRPELRDVATRRNGSLPAVGFSSATTRRPIVVFPQPDSPTSPNVSPSRTERKAHVGDGLHAPDLALEDHAFRLPGTPSRARSISMIDLRAPSQGPRQIARREIPGRLGG